MRMLRISFRQFWFSMMAFAPLLVASMAFGQSASPADVRELKFNKKLERQIATDVTHHYKLALRQGQVLSVELEESDVNVKVDLINARENKTLAAADMGGGFERETLTCVAEQSGEYLLRVSEAEKESGRGKYSLTARLLDAATDNVRTRIQAEQLLMEAVALKKEGTANKMREAISKREQALSLWQSIGERFWESHTLKKLGESHYELFEFGKAASYLNRSLLVVRELGDKKTEAATLQLLGTVMASAGDRQKANEHFNESLQLLKKDNNHLGEAILLYSFGENTYQIGDKPKASEFYNRALSLARTVQNKGWEAFILWGLGQVSDSQNEKPKALELYGQALALWREVKNEAGQGLALAHMGKTYLSQGEAQKALEKFNEALALFRSAKNKVQEALIFSDLSSAYQSLGKAEESIEAIKQTLSSFQGFKHKPYEIIMLGLLATYHNSIGKYEEAIKYAEMAVAAEEVVPEGIAESQRKKQEAQMRQSKAISQSTIGSAYHSLRENEKALLYYHQAVAMFEKDSGQGSKMLALTTLISIGQVYGSQYKWDEALRSYDRALSLAKESDRKANVALIVIAVGNIHLKRSEYRKALDRFEQVQKVIQEIKSNSNNPEDLAYLKRTEAGTLNNIALCYDNLGEPQKALDFYNQSLTIRKETSDKDEEAATLNNIGSVYSGLGDSQKALEYARLAQEAFRQASPVIKASVRSQGIEPNLLNSLGYISRNLGDMRQALDYCNQALSIAEKKGLKHIELAVLSNISGIYYTWGDLRRSQDFSRRVLALSKEIEDKRGEITALSSIGTTNQDLGNKQEALKYLNQALELARAIQNKQFIASSLFSIGQVYSFLDDTKEALNYYNQALLIQTEIGDKRGEAITLADIGFVYNNLGERQQAFGFFNQALAIIRKIGDKKNEATLLGNIGTVYLDLGENRTALEYNVQALTLAQAVGNKQTQASTLNIIGKIHFALGDKQKALAALEQALALCRQNEYNLIESGVLISLGKVHSESGDKQKALQLFNESLQLARRYSDRWYEQRALASMGKVYLETGGAQKAVDSYNQSLLIAREISDREGEAVSCKGLMDVWRSLNNPKTAILYGKQAVNKYQELRGLIRYLKRETQEVYREKVTDAYRELANLLIERGRLPEAQAVLDLLKGAEFRQLQVTRSGESSDTVPYSEAEADVMAKIERLVALRLEERELQNESDKLSPDQKLALERLRQGIKTANAEFETTLDALSQTEASVTRRVAEIRTQQEMQAALDALNEKRKTGVVALYTVIGSESKKGDNHKPKSKFGWVILVTPKDRKAYPIDVKSLEENLSQFRAVLSSDKHNPQPLAEKFYTAIFRQTSARQKTTLETDLQQILGNYPNKTLMWSLDGFLRYIPVSALHDGNRYLVEKYRNVMFTNRGLTSLKDQSKTHWQVLGLGVSERRESFAALPGVARELADIVRQPNETTGVLQGTRKLNYDFNKRTILDLGDSDYQVVHIATHYSFNPANHTASFLLLGDGILSFADIRGENNLFGKLDLLTLSACDTAMGSADGEEAEGFAYLAQSLGAKSVIASLWKVSDAGTPELMIRFYKLRAENPSLSKGEAFRQSQLSLLGAAAMDKQNGANVRGPKISEKGIELPPFVKDANSPFAHPHYWASFILIGNWR